MNDADDAKLKLETFFVELAGADSKSCREEVIEAFLELGFNIAAESERTDAAAWVALNALKHPVRSARYGVQVVAPDKTTIRPREAWTSAHAIAVQLPEGARVEPTFAADIEQPTATERTAESSVGGDSDVPAPDDVRWHHEPIRVSEAQQRMSDLGVKPEAADFNGHPQPECQALHALLKSDVATEAVSTRHRRTVAAISSDLDTMALAELVFHLSLNPQMRREWIAATNDPNENAARETIQDRISSHFSPGLRSQLRRVGRATADLPADAASDERSVEATVSDQTETLNASVGDGQKQEIVIRLNLILTIEDSEQ